MKTVSEKVCVCVQKRKKITVTPRKNYWHTQHRWKLDIQLKRAKQVWVNSIYGDNSKNIVKKVRLVATHYEWRDHGQVKCRRKARVLGLFYILLG